MKASSIAPLNRIYMKVLRALHAEHRLNADLAPAFVWLVVVGVMLDLSTPDSRAAFETAALKIRDMLDCILVAAS